MSCSFRSVGLALVIVTAGCVVADRPARAETEAEAGLQPGTTPFDCTTSAVDYLDDPSLTRAEKLARMDVALSQSLDQFEACHAVSGQAAAPTPAAAGQTTPDAAATLGGDPVRSVASSEIAGTEAPSVRDESAPSTPPASAEIPVATAVVGQGPLPNGRLPADIPAADNDSVLAAQIRKAALQETDPEKRKRLWEEYRRYKDRAVAQEY